MMHNCFPLRYKFALSSHTTLAKGRLGTMLEKPIHRRIGDLSGFNAGG
jgi:hypothetical protein